MTEPADLHDPTTTEFWAAARDGRLIVQCCAACGHHQLYPRPFCMACDSPKPAWAECSGVGTVYSCVQVLLPVHEELPPPYTSGLVELEVGPRLLGRLPAGTVIGDRVVARWRPDGTERPILYFDHVSGEGADGPVGRRPAAGSAGRTGTAAGEAAS
ncbi:hypothetical protein Sru01_60360 [Sphaerisporangium rufum]|uniref:Uncharacterized protein n=1 Tax=Sphaerisporangium rufum TaxID=1381558 RepID=A0A919R7I7_9ACTN|nr:zinc ribbon domain-containing protein [Sphaerisporangium rufum]GII81054.1 hypothetical protein Sru01_60360 [Sphaerisporangium rufum]